ncbi:uncharacterized protein IQ16_07758 [Bradyrhizobium huanghuaihaiense]|uniref:Radical SAM core domain-containing protein n=1 Tax=Bradyrhizobium huanghuaihaiense TaxID=990078 RepID=A0A562QVJ2_9BRAD|nr:radical SAM protein [Bradyrhizobium huanghuaihaiense]TWI60260.1 uncharacterized protein IQ16_07758 [Bradyrhizobium huanghuaihaiense]
MSIRRGAGRSAQFVVKISKYCNLRCTYCYEFAELHKKHRMSLDEIRALFVNIADFVIPNRYDEIEFVWHGGEPFLVPFNYYDEIYRLQKDVFGTEMQVSNGVQTNLTILTEGHLEHLKAGRFFSGLGVSIDPYGDHRVDKKGAQTETRVAANLQRLVDANISFGAIVVVARSTLPHIPDICRFFDDLGVAVRFLPFYLSASEETISKQQIDRHAMSYHELTSSLRTIIDCWFASSKALSWDPLDEYIDFSLDYVGGKSRYFYDRLADESVFVVNLDGQVWGAGDTYIPEFVYGNLFEESLATLLASESRRRRCDQANERMGRYCAKCPYYGACPGFFVGDASSVDEALLDNSGCPVRFAIEELLKRFESAGLLSRFLNPHAEDRLNAKPGYGR